jgi:hypothetical protein
MYKSLVIALPWCAALAGLMSMPGRVQAGPASIGLEASAQAPVIIVGGTTNIQAFVTNTAADGSNDLNYTVKFQLPYGTSTTDPDVLTPGQEQGWQMEFDSSLLPQPLGLDTYFTNVVVSDPGASNSPQTRVVSVEVLNHANPLFWFGEQPIVEPTIAPEQFAATGGGESYAASAPRVIGDPPRDAALDFDTLGEEGDPQITAQNVNFFKSLPALQEGQDPQLFGISPFDVYLDRSHVGTFTKTFILGFSDEDLPGASPTGSVERRITYTFQVVPEPDSTTLMLLGASALLILLGRPGAVAPAIRRVPT